jgi:pyruvate/2-oxoglutarate dehydrogenase complex dihydrolipoamide acyltransferase (E2) component
MYIMGLGFEPRPMMHIALAYDHMLIDGREVSKLDQ